MITVDDLSLQYSGAPLFSKVNLQFYPPANCYGIIGANGAGKSTLIKLILNMTTRDAGRIEVLGLDAMADEERVKEQLGVVLDSS